MSLAAARLFGMTELAIVGASMLLLLGAASAFQLAVGTASRVSRELHPPRVYAGAASRIDLQVENRGRRSTPVLGLRDPVSGTRGANLLVQPLRAGESTRATYQLPTSRRGVLRVGPLEVSVTDPFGLITRSRRAVEPVELTVFPQVDRIEPVPLSSGRDPMSGANHPNSLGRSGEDFYALRPYVIGDDLRRVHWRSSARTEDLLVRQDELPWHGRTTVLVDLRAERHTEESFEAALSAAASIVMSSTHRGDLVRLTTTDGWESTASNGLLHADHILEHLAHLDLTEGGALRDTVDRISPGSTGGAAILLTGALRDGDTDELGALRRRFGSFHLVTFGTRDSTSTPGIVQVHVGPGDDFARSWSDAIRPRSPVLRPHVKAHAVRDTATSADGSS